MSQEFNSATLHSLHVLSNLAVTRRDKGWEQLVHKTNIVINDIKSIQQKLSQHLCSKPKYPENRTQIATNKEQIKTSANDWPRLPVTKIIIRE